MDNDFFASRADEVRERAKKSRQESVVGGQDGTPERPRGSAPRFGEVRDVSWQFAVFSNGGGEDPDEIRGERGRRGDRSVTHPAGHDP